MSFMKKAQAMSRLTKLLSDKNLALLDVLLGGLTDEAEQPIFAQFWAWWNTKRPDDATHTWSALVELKDVLDKYRKGG